MRQAGAVAGPKIYNYLANLRICLFHEPTGVLISPWSDQEGNKLQIFFFLYPFYNHNWRNISTVYTYNKTSIKRNILTIKQNTSGSRSG